MAERNSPVQINYILNIFLLCNTSLDVICNVFYIILWSVGDICAPHGISWHVDGDDWEGQLNDNQLRAARAIATLVGAGLPVIANRSDKVTPRHCSTLLFTSFFISSTSLSPSHYLSPLFNLPPFACVLHATLHKTNLILSAPSTQSVILYIELADAAHLDVLVHLGMWVQPSPCFTCSKHVPPGAVCCLSGVTQYTTIVYIVFSSSTTM